MDMEKKKKKKKKAKGYMGGGIVKNYKDGGLVSSDSNSASGAPTKKRLSVRGGGAATRGLKFYET
tara:strand:+ start:358 stop:552 length:195 start_codon:yes stop_codon:yes gene_type:complete